MHFGSQILILNSGRLQISRHISLVATDFLYKNKEVCLSDHRSLYSIPADCKSAGTLVLLRPTSYVKIKRYAFRIADPYTQFRQIANQPAHLLCCDQLIVAVLNPQSI